MRVGWQLGHGQSNTERGFSVNKQVVDEYLWGKPLISQRLTHDTLVCSNNRLHTFTISPKPKKSYRFHHAKFEADLEKEKEEERTDKRVLKWKRGVKKLTNAKK